MEIFSNQTLTSIANNKTVRKVASAMCNHKDALLPVALLETTVIAGRSYQAYKRGGMTECRERLIDETITAIVWLQIISWLNKGLEKLISIKGIFNKNGLPEISVDPGADAIRNPMRNAVKQRKDIKNIIGGLKLSKIALSALIGIYFSGVMLPKFYQNLTKKIIKKEKAEKQPAPTPKITMQEFLNKTSNKAQNLSFGAINTTINSVAHILENNPIAKLLTIDAGLFAGRAYSARNKDERTEILFRDFISSFFYMACTPLIYLGLSKYVDRFKGKNTDLDPNTANYITKYLQKKIGRNSLSAEEFSKAVLGENDDIVKQILPQLKTDTIKYSRFERIVKNLNLPKELEKQILDNASRFIKLRPQGASKFLLTKSEAINAVQGGYINNPGILTRAVAIATNFASQDKNKFVSVKKIDIIKRNIQKYAQSIIEYAQKTGKKINSDMLTQLRNRNMFVKVGYTLIGMSVSALFLSTLIPKLQYKITEWRTGKKDFPGIKDIK